MKDNEGSAVTSREGWDWLENTVLSSRSFTVKERQSADAKSVICVDRSSTHEV
jgi:hypothetical protein